MSVHFSPETALHHLALLSKQREAADDDARFLHIVVDTEHPFGQKPNRLSQFVQSWRPATVQVSIDSLTGTKQLSVLHDDEASNLAAIRELFHAALSLDTPETERKMTTETTMTTAIDFALTASSSKKDHQCRQLLEDHVQHNLEQASSLASIENVLLGSAAVTALSLSISKCYKKSDNQEAKLFSLLCDRVACLTKTAEVNPVLFSAIIRKILDIALVSIAQKMRADTTPADKQLILKKMWDEIQSIFSAHLINLPPWAQRIADLQNIASLLKVSASLEIPSLQEKILALIQLAKAAQDAEEKSAYIIILKDVSKFIENTAIRTTPLNGIHLESLVETLHENIKHLQTNTDVADMPTYEKTWVVAKKYLFDSAHFTHILSKAFTGAITGAAVGLISGGSPTAIVAGAIAGGVADAAVTVVDAGIDPAVEALPISSRRKAETRSWLRSIFLPLFRLLLALKVSSWASRTVVHQAAVVEAKEKIQTLEQQPPGRNEREIQSQTQELQQAYKLAGVSAVPERLSLSVDPSIPIEEMIKKSAPSAKIVNEQNAWSKRTLTVELPKEEAAAVRKLSVSYPTDIVITNRQEVDTRLSTHAWEFVFGGSVAPTGTRTEL